MIQETDPEKLKQMQQLKQINEMKKKLLGGILSREAYERLARVRIANPQVASQTELYLLQLHQSGKIKDNVTDEQLKEILKLLTTKRETKIIKR